MENRITLESRDYTLKIEGNENEFLLGGKMLIEQSNFNFITAMKLMANVGAFLQNADNSGWLFITTNDGTFEFNSNTKLTISREPNEEAHDNEGF